MDISVIMGAALVFVLTPGWGVRLFCPVLLPMGCGGDLWRGFVAGICGGDLWRGFVVGIGIVSAPSIPQLLQKYHTHTFFIKI